jgi:hypothetical protein
MRLRVLSPPHQLGFGATGTSRKGPHGSGYDAGSQLPVSRWHEQIGDRTLADGILDRLVHNAHCIEMRGDSMRKNRVKTNG